MKVRTGERVINQKRRKKRRNANLKKLAVIAGLLLGAFILIAGGSYFALRSYVMRVDRDKICNNIYIGDVDVSGMTEKEARTAVKNGEVQTYGPQKLTLKIEEESAEATLKELGFGIKDVNGLVKQAAAYGKEGSMWKRYHDMQKLEKEKKVFEPVYTIDTEAAKKIFKERVVPLEKGAKNAKIKRQDGKFEITDEVPGQKLDVKKSVKNIQSYLNKKWTKKEGSVELVSSEDKPKVTAKDLKSIQDKLGSYATNSGGGQRLENLRTGAKYLNGSVILPGEEFSVHDATAPYSTERGYVEAGAYENGELVQSIAGGICQVSTTLYNAVLYAELEVTQRQPHSMLVSYVDPSRDAAIAGDYKDLKFKNNYDTPIYIEGYIAGNGALTFNIYGKDTRDESRSVKFESETTSTKESKTKYVEDSSAPLGEMSKEGSAHTGKEARLWKVVYKNGKEASRDVINRSTYNASNITVKVGTGTDNAEAKKLIRAAIKSQDKGKINAAIAKAKQKIAGASKEDSKENKKDTKAKKSETDDKEKSKDPGEDEQ